MENKSLDCSLTWDSPPSEVVASENEVHVWRVPLDDSRITELRSMLSPDECARADRFHFDRDRNHFIVARSSLRTILGAYLKKNPPELSFSYSNYGKPSLFGEPASNELRFNLSHANELALIAVTRNRAIGVDIEFIRPEFASEEIAERFFSRAEVSALRALPADKQNEAFFNCWTRKEAYIKARGMGLSLALDQFDVSLIPGEPAALLNIREEGQEISNWSLYDLYPGNDYIAALAVEGHASSLKCWQCDSRPVGTGGG